MNANLLTHTLLFVIAVLLLVLVIQNSVYHSTSEKPYQVTESYSPPAPANQQAQPQAPMGAEMVFHALKAFPEGCSGKRILAECDSSAAREVKMKIEKMAEGGQSIRSIFDAIVKTWTEDVLTDEARQIRNQRRSGQ